MKHIVVGSEFNIILSTKTPHILILHRSKMLCFHVPTCTIYKTEKKPKSQKKKQLEKLFKADIDIHLYATTK